MQHDKSGIRLILNWHGSTTPKCRVTIIITMYPKWALFQSLSKFEFQTPFVNLHQPRTFPFSDIDNLFYKSSCKADHFDFQSRSNWFVIPINVTLDTTTTPSVFLRWLLPLNPIQYNPFDFISTTNQNSPQHLCDTVYEFTFHSLTVLEQNTTLPVVLFRPA